MARKIAEETRGRRDHPALKVNPQAVQEGDQLIIRGSGWCDCPVKIEIGGQAVKPFRILQGLPVPDGLRPHSTGSFVVQISTLGIKPGRRRIVATSTHRIRKESVAETVEVLERARFKPDGALAEKPYWRARDFFRRRFGHIGFVPPGTRETQVRDIRRLREVRDRDKPSIPQRDPSFAACNWTPAGAGPMVRVGGAILPAVSGRTLAIAIDPTSPETNRTVYIGTANGGVWKSTDGGATWSPKTDYKGSLAIGALAIDPKEPKRIFAGTGEYWGKGWLNYYGNGLLRSEDGGDKWDELATGQFVHDEISRILFHPTDSQHMFLSSATGVWESKNGGVIWEKLRQGSVSDLVLLADPAQAPIFVLIAGFHGEGLRFSTWNGSSWSPWILTGPVVPGFNGGIALGQSRDNPKVIYAAFSSGAGLAGIFRTKDGGTGWDPVNPPPMPSDQTYYNFHISVHPADPDIVYYGEVRLWKTTTGGTGNALWTDITKSMVDPSGIHVDQHAFAFDPDKPEIIWACNDGGLFLSEAGGKTWSHRNRDLATLQYIHISSHPNWEAVILGGTQDNGAFRYSGNPAWRFSRDGDAGFTAIDSKTPTRMYSGYIANEFYRSDSAGKVGTWVKKTGTIQYSESPDEFYPPFTLDPSDPNVCYYGNHKLWRSPAADPPGSPGNADSWSAITDAFTGEIITAIAVDPTDSKTIYVGTTHGRVYRVKRTGTTWKLADVTKGDLTAPDLPAGKAPPEAVYISDIAVDTGGTVWVTVSSVYWIESTGEFTNDHVYRRDAMTGKWESRSNGLAKANPINTIVIDPTNNDRLFCGGDIGVFRTESAGANWEPWDEGLPNVPAFHLEIHGPRRLLRAATHGRSVWERPIDAPFCKMQDLYMRDNILDTGRVQPTPSGHPHPFEPSAIVHYWESVDIKVDAPDPGFQTPMPIEDYLFFESLLKHRQFKPGAKNRFYVQVHNRGVKPATNVKVQAFFANASAGLPPLPQNFWAELFSGNPSNQYWTPIGNTKLIPVLEAAEPGVVVWEYDVPSTAAEHSCLLALATCDEDPLDGGGILNADNLVRQRKQVTLKNLHLPRLGRGSPLRAKQACILEFHDPYQHRAPFDLVFHWESLPNETRIFVAFEKLPDKKPAVITKPDGLKRYGIVVARPKEKLFQEKLEHGCGQIRLFDLQRIYQLSPVKDRTTIIPSVRRPETDPLLVAINFLLPEKIKGESIRFSVVQQAGRRIVGGSTYLLYP